MIKSRDMIESDIEDYGRWFVYDTKWLNWDSPWELDESTTEEAERQSWKEYYNLIKELSYDKIRW